MRAREVYRLSSMPSSRFMIRRLLIASVSHDCIRERGFSGRLTSFHVRLPMRLSSTRLHIKNISTHDFLSMQKRLLWYQSDVVLTFSHHVHPRTHRVANSSFNFMAGSFP